MNNHATPTVTILDDSIDLCAALSQLISLKLNATCICISSFNELLKNRSEILATKVALLDVNLGDHCPTGIDAQRWLVEQNYGGQMFFFSGHAETSPLLKDIAQTGIRLLNKPMQFSELLSLIEAALLK